MTDQKEYNVYIKINGMHERLFTTKAPSEEKAISNAHARYAASLNMSVPQYRAQIKQCGYTERVEG